MLGKEVEYPSFNFLHLTMQEFLAAYYVSILPNKERLHV